jgi:hypothetical protein
MTFAPLFALSESRLQYHFNQSVAIAIDGMGKRKRQAEQR